MIHDVRTWIEIDTKALEHNLKEILKSIPQKTRFMAVVKSNAYGHGLVQVAKQLARYKSIWFGVDSIVEALRLRREEIKNPILVLGGTLPGKLKEAAEKNIVVSISNFESLEALAKLKTRPEFHIKIDTGMYRQGFLPDDTKRLIKTLKQKKLEPQGIFTHFASAKDIAYPTHTYEQFRKFGETKKKFLAAGFRKIICHAAASGGTMLFPETHADMVRVGMGLYGYFPSDEARIHLENNIELHPVLSWKTRVGEIKMIPAGSHVGYDLTERVSRKTKLAVLPIGYWHGYDRGLSSVGEVLIRGKRTKIIGRISMDMVVVDVTDIKKLKIGDEVVLIGKQGRNAIWGDELALKIGTSQYEFLTRTNPLIRRVIK